MFRLRYAQRAFHVASVLLRNLWEISRERLLGRRGISGPLRLRMLLEELGGAFLKFGQILSLQVDSLPRKYCDALLNLLDRVPPFEREEIRRIFYEEFEIPAEELYLKFDYVPIASASIGQVHRATLKDGTAVAVKVQRPGVRELFHRDGALLRALVRLVFFLRIRSLYFLRDPVREFNEWLEDELDYRREAAYGEALRRNAEGTPAEKIPKIYWDLTSSRVLTMDFLEGMSVMQYLRVVERQDEYHLKELRDLGFVPSQFVTNVINNFMSDAFRHGLFAIG